MNTKKLIKENLALKHLLEMEKWHGQRLEKSVKAAKLLRHDFKHHLRQLEYLMDKRKIEAAKEYIYTLLGEERYFPSGIYSGNVIVDGILARYLYKAQTLGIIVTHSVLLPPDLPVEEVDLCTILGNLATNSIEGCARILNTSKVKFIDVDIKIAKEYLYIKFVNSFDGNFKMENGVYKTVKLKGDIKGLGLEEVQTVVDKYAGALDIEREKEIFKVFTMLRLGKMVK